MKYFAALSVIAMLGLAPAYAAPDQLVTSVQQRLDILGLRDVDASTLSNRQIAALHLRLQGPQGFGPARVRLQQEVKAILRWKD